jgi:hypothetical protein
MNNPRIIRQDGYFFVFGIDGEKKSCAEIDQDWLGEPVTIPSAVKDALLEELNHLNINEAFVYPDYKHANEDVRHKYG